MAALAATTTAQAEECSHNTGVCLGVDWKTVTPADVADIDVRLTQAILQNNQHQKRTVRITPLHWAAAYSKNPAVIAALLDSGADIKAKGYNGGSPLHWAATGSENPAIITLLLKAGADINAKETLSGHTPLHFAASSNDNPAVVQALLDAGADIKAAIPSSGATPMHLAAYSKSTAVWPVLLRAGGDINIRNKHQGTPLFFAALNNRNPAVIAYMLAAGAEVNPKNSNNSPIYMAAVVNTPVILAILIEAGATVRPELSEVVQESLAQKDKEAAIAVLQKSEAAEEIFAEARQIMREAALLWKTHQAE